MAGGMSEMARSISVIQALRRMNMAGGESKTVLLNFGFTGLAQNEYGWWYIRSGMLDFSYTGYVGWYGVNYRVQNGQVIF